MVSFILLIVIFICFISLGLPDSMLGAAWPMMYGDLNALVTNAGLLSMMTCFGTIISALSYAKVSKKLSTRAIISISILFTCIGLFFFSLAHSFYFLLPIALILGIGGGAIDSTLNNYVSRHYSTSTMAFLHGFWGIGTTIGPILLGVIVPLGYTWRTGYRVLSIIQAFILLLSLFSFPLWKKAEGKDYDLSSEKNKNSNVKYIDAIRTKGATYGFLGFFGYCAGECTVMVWGSTYMVYKGLEQSISATYSSFFFWGMTIGRMLTGLLSIKIGSERLIRFGFVLIAVSLLLFSFIPAYLIFIPLFLIGLGCAPIYPLMIHQTPLLYEEKYCNILIGLQMASAYVGSTLIPPLFGFLYKIIGMWVMPLFLLLFFLISFISAEKKRSLIMEKIIKQ